MNSETAINLLKKGFHVTLGATSSIVESLQDPVKREENLAQLRVNPNDFAEILAEKGAVTEVEARKFVDSMVSQYAPNSATPTPGNPMAHPPSVDPNLQMELKDLTKQLAEIRAQLNRKAES